MQEGNITAVCFSVAEIFKLKQKKKAIFVCEQQLGTHMCVCVCVCGEWNMHFTGKVRYFCLVLNCKMAVWQLRVGLVLGLKFCSGFRLSDHSAGIDHLLDYIILHPRPSSSHLVKKMHFFSGYWVGLGNGRETKRKSILKAPQKYENKPKHKHVSVIWKWWTPQVTKTCSFPYFFFHWSKTERAFQKASVSIASHTVHVCMTTETQQTQHQYGCPTFPWGLC